MHVCFEHPSTIRGFKNISPAKKTSAHQYSSRKIHIKIYFCKSNMRDYHYTSPYKKYTFDKLNMKDYHYTMMHVCFGRPSTIRGFNNCLLAKKYPDFST